MGRRVFVDRVEVGGFSVNFYFRYIICDHLEVKDKVGG